MTKYTVTCTTVFEIDTEEDVMDMINDYGFSADIDYQEIVAKQVDWFVS